MPAAAAAASLAVALVLHPLVQGWAWYVAVIAMVATIAGTGVLTRRFTRNPLVVLCAQCLACVVVLTVLFVRDDAVFGLLPGPGAVRALVALTAQGGAVTARQSAPVDATQGVLLLIAAGMGLVALSVDVVAVAWRRPAVAGLALLTVYCVPVAILGGGTSWVWFAVTALAYLALLAAEGQDRIRSWGRVLTGDRAGAARVDLTSATGARQAALASVLLAVLVPALVPAFTTGLSGVGGWGKGSGNGTQIKVLNPILDIRKDLGQQSGTVVLTYSTTMVDNPPPLRVVADDVFNGTTWAPTVAKIPTGNRVQDGLAPPPGLSPGVPRTPERTTIQIGPQLSQTYLPLPYPATKVDIDGDWIYNSSTLDVLGEKDRTDGQSYVVDHLDVHPTADQLARSGPVPQELQREYTRLPAGVPKLIVDTARRVAGQGSPYDQSVRLQQYFRNAGGFTYSTQAPGNGSDDASFKVIEEFLTQKRGYCVHFASTMAVMARLLGIPARVAVGFLPGSPQGDPSGGRSTWQVTFKNAHAWPELYFAGIGWVRFEPTPATQSGEPPSWTIPSTRPTPAPSASVSRSRRSSPQAGRPTDALPKGGRHSPGLLGVLEATPWRLVLAGAVLAGLAFVPHGLAVARRAWRWRSVLTRSDRAEAAWDDLRSRCADLAVIWPASHTPRAAREDLVAGYELPGPARDALGRLLADLETARYAPPTEDPGRSAQELRSDVRSVSGAVAAAVPKQVRRRAWWLPVTAWQGVETLDQVHDVRDRIR